MTGKTISGSDVALIREPSSTTWVNLGVNGDNTTSSKPLFDFDRLIGVLTVLVENVSSTETLPTRGPAPEINPTENNALLDSAEKVKTKVESEISPPKVEYLRKTPRAQTPSRNQLRKRKALSTLLHQHICLRAKS